MAGADEAGWLQWARGIVVLPVGARGRRQPGAAARTSAPPLLAEARRGSMAAAIMIAAMIA